MTDPQAEMFAARVDEVDDSYPGYAAAWARLAAAVLAHGGTHVVPPLGPELLADELSARGELWSGVARVLPGRESGCHDNAVALWRDGRAVAIGTGYALSDDGLWREHSWAVAGDGAVIETTEPRAGYFGLTLTGDEAEGFARWIEGGDPPVDPAFAR